MKSTIQSILCMAAPVAWALSIWLPLRFFYDVSVEYLLGLSNSCKQEYHDISEQLGLCDKAIDELIQCKENSSSEEGQQLYVSQDTAILNDFLISAEFKRVMEKIKQGLFAYYMYQLS